MQTLDIISVNLWQILISLANLLIIFLVVKKFLFKPVKNMMAKRQAEIDAQYADAAAAQKTADDNKAEWEQKLSTAKEQAEGIIQSATTNADRRADTMIAEAKEKASQIVKKAEEDAVLTKKKAEAEIKGEIADISVALAQKMLEREINADDHRDLIDSVIAKIGEDDDSNK